jgi:hypothetical protein
MEDQLGALGLVLNCVTLWNTLYLDHALSTLRARGYTVTDTDAGRFSAYQYRHINVHGHYSFGPARPRRQPPAPARSRRARRGVRHAELPGNHATTVADM